jgi:hypothetical protein
MKTIIKMLVITSLVSLVGCTPKTEYVDRVITKTEIMVPKLDKENLKQSCPKPKSLYELIPSLAKYKADPQNVNIPEQELLAAINSLEKGHIGCYKALSSTFKIYDGMSAELEKGSTNENK